MPMDHTEHSVAQSFLEPTEAPEATPARLGQPQRWPSSKPPPNDRAHGSIGVECFNLSVVDSMIHIPKGKAGEGPSSLVDPKGCARLLAYRTV